MNNTTPAIIFDHSRYKLKVWKNTAPLDVVAFSGQEGLSQPFRYVIEFTSPEKDIKPAQMLMRDAAFTQIVRHIATSYAGQSPKRWRLCWLYCVGSLNAMPFIMFVIWRRVLCMACYTTRRSICTPGYNPCCPVRRVTVPVVMLIAQPDCQKKRGGRWRENAVIPKHPLFLHKIRRYSHESTIMQNV